MVAAFAVGMVLEVSPVEVLTFYSIAGATSVAAVIVVDNNYGSKRKNMGSIDFVCQECFGQYFILKTF